jgi:hypothetical protein
MTERMFADRADVSVDENVARSENCAWKSTPTERNVEKEVERFAHNPVDNPLSRALRRGSVVSVTLGIVRGEQRARCE